MSGQVTFDEENVNTVSNISISRGAPTGMTAWLVKQKIVENARQGEQFLLVVAVLIIVAAAAIVFFFAVPHPSLGHITSVPGPNGTLVPVSSQ